MARVDKEVPWCTIILVFGALLCHTIVLYGNYETASGLQVIGTSTAGWSKVGIGLAHSFRNELDTTMGEINDKLTVAINKTLGVQQYIDIVVSLVGNATEEASTHAKAALLQVEGPGPHSMATLPDTILSGVNKTLETVLAKLTEELQDFLVKIKPALEQAGSLILKFGDKITQILTSFSLTLDTVQKMFDQIMAQLNTQKTPGIKAQMLHETFSLFDVSGTGYISESDLENVAKIYSVDALQGTKPHDLMVKYDEDKDKQLTAAEFSNLVDDSSIPGAMAIVLRMYASRLSQVSGLVGAARKRDEVAMAVVNYFELVCAKSRTKLGWVADALGNASLPIAFTADIFKNLAVEVDNTDVLTTADVGQVVVSEMMKLHPQTTLQAYDLMCTPLHWQSEGFDSSIQPLCIQRVTKWIVQAKSEAGMSLMEEEESFMHESFVNEARALAEENMASHQNARHSAAAAHRASLFHTESSQFLLHHLLGGVPASGDAASQMAERCLSTGVPAVPETLQFAKFLAFNSSDTANRLQKECFAYTSTSSSPLDSFANTIQGMIKKMTGFINMVEQYSTPAGIELLEKQINGFAAKAGDDMIKVVMKKLDKVVHEGAPKLQSGINTAIKEVGQKIGAIAGKQVGEPLISALKAPVEEVIGEALEDKEAGVKIGDMLSDVVSAKLGNMTSGVLATKIEDFLNKSVNYGIGHLGDFMDEDKEVGKLSLVEHSEWHQLGGLEGLDEAEALQLDMSGAMASIAGVLSTMVKLLPQATDNLKFAKKEIGECAKIMDSVFEGFETKGPEIFDNIAGLWKMLWTLYWVVLLPMTLGLLYYGFWASGYFGGPQWADVAEGDQEAPPPSTFRDRIGNCCTACSVCMQDFHDTQLCFWSFIIIFEVVCLLIFVISLVLCILAGVKSFLVAGCSQVYLLSDEQVCQETIVVLRQFLETYAVGIPTTPLDQICGVNNLLTCDAMSSKMKASTLHTSVFSFLAAVFSFQMIIESACLHTRARYRREISAIKEDEQ